MFVVAFGLHIGAGVVLLGLCACDLGLKRLWLLCFVDLLLFGLVSSVDHTPVCCFLLVVVVYGAFVLVCLITCLFWFISSLVCCVVCFSDVDLVVCWRGGFGFGLLVYGFGVGFGCFWVCLV